MTVPFTYTKENNLTFLHPGEAGDVNTRIVKGVYHTMDDMSSGVQFTSSIRQGCSGTPHHLRGVTTKAEEIPKGFVLMQ